MQERSERHDNVEEIVRLVQVEEGFFSSFQWSTDHGLLTPLRVPDRATEVDHSEESPKRRFVKD